MILLTGAGGRTGRAVLSALVDRGADVRAFIRKPDQAEGLRSLGAAEIAMGDMQDDASIRSAVDGVDLVLHIGPPMHPDEVAITDAFLNASRDADVGRFLYYSVMHPFRREVRHHALKLEATEHVVDSGLPYTIVEPCRYMQHLDPIWKTVVETGVHAMPFSTGVPFSVVHLGDLAEVTAKVAVESGHEYATYELAGPEPLSQDDMAAIISQVLGRQVRAERVPLDVMAANAAAKGFSADRVEQMRRMNAHYDHGGFPGNPHILEWLLERPATRYVEYVSALAGQ
jgi:uncharacterized protein YbjT (DUF2867 family)